MLLPPEESTRALEQLFERERVVTLDALFRTLRTRSRMSVFRRLSPLGYLSSYSHAGRFYTLERLPSFDENGLWQHQGVLFSSQGSLKTTVWHLVDRSRAGWTHEELRDRLRVRVHNTLLDLVRERRIQREAFEAVLLYLSASATRAASQRKQRLRQGAPGAATVLEPFLVVAILVEVIHDARLVPAAAAVAARLAARGIQVSIPAVEAIYEQHGLGKKTARSPSTRSGR